MANTKIATLGSIGWVDSVNEKGDYAISCFIATNKSQTVEYAGNITSLQYLVKVNAGKPRQLEIDIRQALDRQMTDYFGTSAVIDCTVEENEQNISQLVIRFRCTLNIDGSTYVLGRVVQFVDARIIGIAKLNNG